MKKVRKAYKLLKKDLKKAIKKAVRKETEVVVKFQADTRYEYIVSNKEWKKGDPIVNSLKYFNVQLRKDCCSVTKNGDYHLLYTTERTVPGSCKPNKETVEELADKMVKTILTHKCRCKKDQEKKARSMICKAKRVNGRWIY